MFPPIAVLAAATAVFARTGHLPQIETPEALIETVWTFADAHATGKPVS